MSLPSRVHLASDVLAYGVVALVRSVLCQDVKQGTWRPETGVCFSTDGFHSSCSGSASHAMSILWWGLVGRSLKLIIKALLCGQCGPALNLPRRPCTRVRQTNVLGGMGGKVGGNIMVILGDNVEGCTAGSRLRGWRYSTEVASFPSWLEMLGSCLGRTAGDRWWGSQQSWGDGARLSEEKWGAYGSTGIVDTGV